MKGKACKNCLLASEKHSEECATCSGLVAKRVGKVKKAKWYEKKKSADDK